MSYDHTLERRVGFEWLKLFIRYQIDFRILFPILGPVDATDKDKYSRSERCNTDTSTNKQDGFIIQIILTRTAKRTIYHDTRKRAIDRWVVNGANNLPTSRCISFTL